jgi:D-tyrosyl-tRNA(Tyr) deacylase
MLSVIQLVKHGMVEVNGAMIASIQKGILALIGIEAGDTAKEAEKLVQKIINYRIFPDESGKMNRSLVDVSGGLLLVPQFTLVAETSNGNRPGFSKGMPPQEGRLLFAYLVDYAKKQQVYIQHGLFGADMQVSLCNDGPATFILKM